jgi:hypothetical protein
MPDGHLVTLLSAAFSVSIPMIQLQQGAAYSDNQRDVSEAAFEADTVAVVIWNMLRTKPQGFARRSRDQQLHHRNHASLAVNWLVPRGTTSPTFPVSVLVACRPPLRRSASRDWEAPGSNGAELHTIGEG